MAEKNVVKNSEELLDLQQLLEENPQLDPVKFSSGGSINVSIVNSSLNAELSGKLNKKGVKANNGNNVSVSKKIIEEIIPEDSIVTKTVMVRNKATQSKEEKMRRFSNIQFMHVKDTLYVSHHIKDSLASYEINVDNPIIYRKDLIDLLTKVFKLDYSKHVSISFGGKIQTTADGSKCAVLTQRKKIDVDVENEEETEEVVAE